MKSLKILAISLLGAALGTAAVSCTEESPVKDSISLSVTSFTFAAEGESFSLNVEASSISGEDWSYQGGEDWITIERSDNGLILTAVPNETGAERSTTVSFISGEAGATLSLSQLYEKFPGSFVNMNAGLYGYQSKFSLNSRYCGAYTGEEGTDGTTLFVPILINLETGEETRYEGNANYKGIRAVSDDGRMMSLEVGSIGCALLVDGAVTDIPTPSGYENPVIVNFSADGNVMVGYVKETDGYAYYPVKWTDMTPEVLEIPETNVQGEDLFAGAMARGCSADGSVVYGSEWDTWGFIYWDAEGMHFAGKETAVMRTISYMGMTLEMPAYFRKTGENYSISQNGRYVAGTFCDYIDNGDGTYSPYTNTYPAVYDIQTDELTVFDEAGHTAMFADNEGSVFGGVGGIGYVYGESGSTPVNEWLAAHYGIMVDGDRYIMNISEDGTRMSGWRQVMNASSQSLLIGWYYVQK